MKMPFVNPADLPTALPMIAVLVSLSGLGGAHAQEEKKQDPPPGPGQIESVFDTLNQAYDNSVTQSVQNAITNRMEQTADLEQNVSRYRDLSVAEKAMQRTSLPDVEKKVKVAQGNLDFLNKGLRLVNVLGPVGTGLGVLAGGGSLNEAMIGGVNDFEKFWVQEAATAGGVAFGAPAGPIVSIGTGMVAGSLAGEKYDEKIGVVFEEWQQRDADGVSLQTYGPLDKDKLERLTDLIGAQQRRADFQVDMEQKRAEQAEEERSRRISAEQDGKTVKSAIAGPKMVIGKLPPVEEPPADPLGPRPAEWPANEPWPPTVDKLVEMMVNSKKASLEIHPIESAPKGNQSDFETPPVPPTPPPPVASTPPEAGTESDFTDPNTGSNPPPPAFGGPPEGPVVAQPPGGFDASGFARGQARDAAAAAAVVQGDYDEATRIENALRLAEEEFRRATLEAQRIAAQKQAAHQASENAKAQRRAYDAYQRYLAQVKAYNQWAANAQRAQQRPSGHSVPHRQATPGHKSGGLIMDPPQ